MNLGEYRSAWIAEKPKTRGNIAFAQWLGYTEQLVHHWIKNGVTPRLPIIIAINAKTCGHVSFKDWQ